MSKYIVLKNGVKSIVDDDVFEQIKGYTRCSRSGYVEIYIGGKYVFLHKFIMGCPEGLEVDHINCNKLDNRRKNLRVCTHSQNNRNKQRYRNNTSGYKGVSWDKKREKWRVQIAINNSDKHIGYFDDKIEAARAYNEAARQYHGDFAKLNFVKANL